MKFHNSHYIIGLWSTPHTLGTGAGIVRRHSLEPLRMYAVAEDGMSLDSRSVDKDLKAVTPEKNKAFVTTFTQKSWCPNTSYSEPESRSGQISLKQAKLIDIRELFHISK